MITNEENWHVVKQKNVWGVAERHRNTIAKVNKGDTLVMSGMNLYRQNCLTKTLHRYFTHI